MENKKVLEFGEIAYLRKEKFNPQKDTNSKKCIELEHLSQETGQLLGYVDSQEQKSTKNVFCENDVLFGKLRPYLKKFWFAKFEGVCSSEIWVLRAKKEVCVQEYLYYLIQTHKFNQVANVSSGSKMPRADWKFIINSPFSIINSRTEQTKIANFLSLVDKKIENGKLIIDNLKLYKRGLMQQIFSQKLRFKPVLSDSEGAKKGQNFPDWEWKHGNEVFKTVSDKNHNSDLPILAITQDKGAIPRDEIDYNISVTEKSIDSYKVVQVGDFIISLRSFQGGIEYSNFKGICSPAYIILRPYIEIEDMFYKFYLKTERYIRILKTKLEGIRDGKMISYKYFSEIKLPYPTIQEQKKIADFLSAIDRKIENEKLKLEHLKEWKKGLLQKMFI